MHVNRAHPQQIPWTHTSASDFTLLLDGEVEWQKRLQMVRSAKSFLYLSTFYYELDEYGDTMLRELRSAQERGVEVTLIIDAFGQRLAAALMPRRQRRALRRRLRHLQESGVRVQFYRPPKPLQRWLGAGYHIKIQVADTGEAIFGSGNISQMSFGKWMEFAAVLRGPAAVVLLAELKKLCDSSPSESSAHLRALARAAAQKGSRTYKFDYLCCNPCLDSSWLSPIRQSLANPITRELVRAIDGARKSVLLTSFYAKPAPVLFQAIERAAQRGVHVEIHHSHMAALPEARVAWLVASLGYPRWLRAGVHIYEHADGQHTKFVLVDGEQAWFGSYNFEHAADDRLAEAMFVTRDPKVLGQVKQLFVDLRNDPRNKRAGEEAVTDLPPRLKAYRCLCYPLRRWLQ